MEIGKRTKIKVTSGKGGIEWVDEETGVKGKNKQELMDNSWKKYAQNNKLDEKDTTKKEEYLWDQWNIRKKITANVTNDGVEVDITNNVDARQNIKDAITKAAEGTLDTAKTDKTGNVDVTLDNGMHVTLDGETVIDSDGNINYDQVATEL